MCCSKLLFIVNCALGMEQKTLYTNIYILYKYFDSTPSNVSMCHLVWYALFVAFFSSPSVRNSTSTEQYDVLHCKGFIIMNHIMCYICYL